jgi:two-component sensor histidine kinase
MHELTTNALKYGALSAPAGKVAVELSVTGPRSDRRVTIDRKETGGPKVTAPKRRGFGKRLAKEARRMNSAARRNSDSIRAVLAAG